MQLITGFVKYCSLSEVISDLKRLPTEYLLRVSSIPDKSITIEFTTQLSDQESNQLGMTEFTEHDKKKWEEAKNILSFFTDRTPTTEFTEHDRTQWEHAKRGVQQYGVKPNPNQ